jgi:hypothetical protein
MFCQLWSTILYSEDGVEEGGIKIKEKKLICFRENGNFLGRNSEKR